MSQAHSIVSSTTQLSLVSTSDEFQYLTNSGAVWLFAARSSALSDSNSSLNEQEACLLISPLIYVTVILYQFYLMASKYFSCREGNKWMIFGIILYVNSILSDTRVQMWADLSITPSSLTTIFFIWEQKLLWNSFWEGWNVLLFFWACKFQLSSAVHLW